MRVACFDPLPISTLMWIGAQPMLSVIVKITFDLLPDGRAVRADVQRPLSEDGPPGATVLHECCDHLPYKPAADLLIVGHAKSPVPTLQIPIRIACPPQFERRFVARASQPSQYVPLTPLYLRSAAGEPVQVGPNALAHDARRTPNLGHNFDYARFNVAPPAQQLAHHFAAMGLVSEVVPSAELLARTARVAANVAAQAPLALQAIKRTVMETHTLPWGEAFDVEKREAGGVMRSQDAREGPRAFKERREPTFEGR